MKLALCLPPDLVKFLLQNKSVDRGERKTKKQRNAAFENCERIPERAFKLLSSSLHGRRVGNAPVCGHGLARPEGADFIDRVVADGKDKIQFRSVWRGKLVPTLAAKPIHRNMRSLQPRDCLRTHL